MTNLAETAYLLTYPQGHCAVVPGCESLTEAIQNSCIPVKPSLAYVLRGGQWLLLSSIDLDLAWYQVAVMGEIAA